MSSTEIQVTTSTLSSKREELSNLNAKFNQQLGTLDGHERELMSMWEGESATEFHQQYTIDQQKMVELYKAVAEYCEKLGIIITKYEAAERKNVEIAKSRG